MGYLNSLLHAGGILVNTKCLGLFSSVPDDFLCLLSFSAADDTFSLSTHSLLTSLFQINATHVTYRNAIFFYSNHNDSFSLPVSLNFRCAYPMDSDVSLDVVVKPFLS